jgi:hypothetical protein
MVTPVEWSENSMPQEDLVEDLIPEDFDTSEYGPEYDYLPEQAYASYGDCNALRDGWYAGAEIVIVKPYWEDEVDRVTTQLPNSQDELVPLVDPEYSCSATPRLYLGYRNCDELGIRVRYWEFDESGKPATFDEPFETTVNSDLQVKALDLETTKILHAGRFQLELTGGVRYAKSRVNASQVNTFLGEVTGFGTGRSSFEGVGPTISAEAWHQLGHSHFAIVGNIRGGMLFGKSNIESVTSVGDELIRSGTDGKDDVVPVLESQIGLEYSKCFSLRKRLAFRTMMEGQWWGVSTPGASFPVELGSALGVGGDVFNTSRDLGFFGVTAALIYEH